MKLLFSEHKSDYAHYIFPYAIWAFPEPGETPADCFEHGFLPAASDLSRFYMCRHVRVRLAGFAPSSENRRILRKGEGIECELVARSDFDYSADRRHFYKTYADIKFGKDVMSYERLDRLFAARITSHLLLFIDSATGKEVGAATVYLQPPRLAYYYYAFYDLNYYERNLGMFMMTSAVRFFAGQGIDFLYLGSCYSRNALYKTQFSGAEFFAGFAWSTDLDELKYLIERDSGAVSQHLLETEAYIDTFHDGDLRGVVAQSTFEIQARR